VAPDWLPLLWVDGGYAGAGFADWVKTLRPKLEVAVVKRTDQLSGFKVLPRRWVVERTFGWLMRHPAWSVTTKRPNLAPKLGPISR
jgi:transposase